MSSSGRNGITHRAWLIRAAVAGLLVTHAGMAVWSLRQKSATFDEVAHLTAGYSTWATNDYRLMRAGLAQRWAALPLLIGNDRPPSFEGPDWWRSNPWFSMRQPVATTW